MTAQSGGPTGNADPIDAVAPGDIIVLPPSVALPPSLATAGSDGSPRQFKVVYKTLPNPAGPNSGAADSGSTVIVTLEGDDGETGDVELPAGTVVERTLESKWESPQSPTPHDPTADER